MITRFTMVFLVQAMFMTAPAFAFRGDLGESTAAIRQEINAGRSKPTMVRVEGKLLCDMGGSNGGQPCALKIEEIKTGRTYVLLQASDAMKLYQEGSKNVAVEGKFAGGDDAIQVDRAESL